MIACNNLQHLSKRYRLWQHAFVLFDNTYAKNNRDIVFVTNNQANFSSICCHSKMIVNTSTLFRHLPLTFYFLSSFFFLLLSQTNEEFLLRMVGYSSILYNKAVIKWLSFLTLSNECLTSILCCFFYWISFFPYVLHQKGERIKQIEKTKRIPWKKKKE
jgi:hypothetical protein